MPSVAELRAKFSSSGSSAPPPLASPDAFERHRREHISTAQHSRARQFNSAMRRSVKRAAAASSPSRTQTSERVKSVSLASSNPLFQLHANEVLHEADAAAGAPVTAVAVPTEPSALELVREADELNTGAARHVMQRPDSKHEDDDKRTEALAWVRSTVLMNKPSTSDLLLRGGGSKHSSLTSIGPSVVLPAREVCRLDPSVDVRTLLSVFYQTYDPAKLSSLDLVLDHFRGRTEALLFTLECKYLISITQDGRVEPQRPIDAYPPEHVEDEVVAAKRASNLSEYSGFSGATAGESDETAPAAKAAAVDRSKEAMKRSQLSWMLFKLGV